MIVITVNFTHVIISKFIRNEPVTLKIHFNDGKEKSIEKTTNLDNVENFVSEVLSDVKKLEKESNSKGTGGFLDDVVMVRLGDDEEKVEEKLFHAFARIKEDIRKLKSGATPQNFLQKIAMFQNSKYTI